MIKIKGYSWVDPPLSIPYVNSGTTEGAGGGSLLLYPITDDQIGVMLEFLRGLMVGPEVYMVEYHMRTSEDYKRGVWKKLVCFEDHKRFFGREVVEVLRGFKGKGLRSVDMCGTVDRKWMKAVADVTGVTVRARVQEEEELVLVRPGEVE